MTKAGAEILVKATGDDQMILIKRLMAWADLNVFFAFASNEY